MPQVWDEFTDRELSYVLAESPYHADAMLGLAMDLEVKLPGTKAAFRAGILRESKAAIIAAGVETLDPAEARAAEALVLGRAGRLSPGGLRAAIARAAMQIAPDKARKRREHAARRARVERLPEPSGNAALFGRELPPAEVIAADQRISWWARQLKDAGMTGTTDQLRARAYLDLLLGTSSLPAQPSVGSSKPLDPDGPFAPPWAGAVPPGFAGRLHLTIPLITLVDLADRPGEIAGTGPVDPALARDLARATATAATATTPATATATAPKTTWCFTVTDEQGHAIGHGCARPEPRSRTNAARNTTRPRRGTAPDTRSPAPTPTVRPADTAPGASPPASPASPPCSSPWTPSLSTPATTGTRRPGTTPAASSVILRRSGTPTAPARPAAIPPRPPTSSTTPRTKQAAGRACATAARNAAVSTASSSTPAGKSTSPPPAPSAGPHPLAARSPPSPPATPSRAGSGDPLAASG